MKITIGEAIRKERKRLGMTTEEFGEALGGASAMWVETYMEAAESLDNVTARALLAMARIGAKPLDVMLQHERGAQGDTPPVVTLRGCGKSPIKVIKVIRAHCGIGLMRAKVVTDIARRLGAVVLNDAMPNHATGVWVADFVCDLRQAGATVDVKEVS